MSNSIQSNKLLRIELRKKRSDIAPHTRLGHDAAIRQHLKQLIASRQVTSLACYWPFDGEPDLTPLFKQLIASNCGLALPVISGEADHKMEFYPWSADEVLIKNRYGINEPQKTISIPLSGFDMLLIPLVAYDKSGNRMGMGAGYYDRHLESLRDSHHPLRVGVAYSLQEVEPITRNEWDIPLHGIITERGWNSF